MVSFYLKTGKVKASAGLSVAAALLAFGLSLPVSAQIPSNQIPPKGVNKIIRTLLPSWQVGDLDKKLSQMCSLGRFNQRVPYKYSAHFQGPNGAAMVGGAKGNGLNLFDPTGARQQGRDYWFYRDRTSNCIVYSAKVKPEQSAIQPPPS
ncbi:MAG: hypothetical protein ACOVKO_08850 [Elstera sp.]